MVQSNHRLYKLLINIAAYLEKFHHTEAKNKNKRNINPHSFTKHTSSVVEVLEHEKQ
jgi:hypothetical protein